MQQDTTTGQPLASLFAAAWNSHQQLGTSEGAEGHEREVLSYWMEVEARITADAIFSSNETFDDVPTSSVRFVWRYLYM